jgi:exoribonuclease R
MPEIELEMDRDGKVLGAHRVENTVSHQIIEEFMLAANEAWPLAARPPAVLSASNPREP